MAPRPCSQCFPREDPLLEIAVELEKIATQDEYFVKRGLYPNVDFFSGGCVQQRKVL